MRYEIHKSTVPVTPALERVISRKVAKVEQRLKTYHPDAAGLEIRLVEGVKADRYQCCLTLNAFKDSLHAAKSSQELRGAVDRAFDAMLKELEGYRARHNKSLQAHG